MGGCESPNHKGCYIYWQTGIMETTESANLEKKTALGFKAFFFFKYMGQGVLYPFLVLYLNGKGITGAELGLLLTLLPLGKVAIAPVLSYLCDLYRIHKPMLITSMFFNTIGGFLLYRSEDVFASFVFAMVLITLGEAVGDTLGITLALDFLAPRNRQTDYGKWRLWGAVGYMAGALFLGLFVLDSNIALVPLVFTLANLAAGLAAMIHPRASAKKPQDWLGGLKILKEVRGFVLLLVGAVFSGFTFNVIQSFYSVYMIELGAASWMVGVGVGLQVLIEILLSANTKRITDRIPLRYVYLSGFLVLPIRTVLYLLNRNPFTGLMIQNLHGFFIFSAFITGILVLDRVLPGEWRATGQSYYVSAVVGIGAMAGSFFAPLVYDMSGMPALWIMAAAVGFTGFGLVTWATKILPGLASEKTEKGKV